MAETGREYAFAEVEIGHSAAFLANDRCAAHSWPRWRSTPTAALAEERTVAALDINVELTG